MGNFGSCKTKGVHVALLQHSIPTLDVLNHRNMADTRHCLLCDTLQESGTLPSAMAEAKACLADDKGCRLPADGNRSGW